MRAGAIDLHVHTSISDGTLTPSEVVRLALRHGIKVLAITDHDTVEGVPEALQAAAGSALRVIPGVEISTHLADAELHILGYLIDHTHPVLADTLAHFRRQRLDRARRMVRRLEDLGIPLSWERVLDLAGQGVVGRTHVARALQEAGFVGSIQEAFREYLGRKGPAYVPRPKMTPGQAIELIRSAGGVPVLAHPWGLTSFIPELVRDGLQGLEVYYPGYSVEIVAELERLTRQYDLVCTGGSDFHGLDEAPENQLGAVSVPKACLRELEARKQRATS
ncbi:MAG: PHP domain-containing protein [Chloroflexi bacterium]|nr:PHP domain-containing protein [Chloroflexota bacterium]